MTASRQAKRRTLMWLMWQRLCTQRTREHSDRGGGGGQGRRTDERRLKGGERTGVGVGVQVEKVMP